MCPGNNRCLHLDAADVMVLYSIYQKYARVKCSVTPWLLYIVSPEERRFGNTNLHSQSDSIPHSVLNTSFLTYLIDFLILKPNYLQLSH